MFIVTCAECSEKTGYPVKSEFPDRAGAEAFIRRHHAFTGHRADIQEGQ